jgi:hypothetical protein
MPGAPLKPATNMLAGLSLPDTDRVASRCSMGERLDITIYVFSPLEWPASIAARIAV